MLPLLAACGGGNSHFLASSKENKEIKLDYAVNLTLSQSDGVTKAEISNPWDTTRILHTYILVPDSIKIPENLPKGTVVRTPLKRSIIYSSVHNSLVTELGALEAIGGVCDAQYIHQKELADRIASGKVTDCGNSMMPDIEKIIKLQPDAILLSPFENSGTYGKLGQLGIPIIECADYMETSPLGRAEWMKFYGMLFGKEEDANLKFQQTETEYNRLKNLASNLKSQPKVLVDRFYGSTWNVPGAHSTMGIFIEDAGGKNPFDYLDKSGSTPLSGEHILTKAGDADIWIIRYSQTTDKPLSELKSDNAIYAKIKAAKEGNVYGCNTSEVRFYEEVPFHPQWLLSQLITIFHPELSQIEENHVYFTKMK